MPFLHYLAQLLCHLIYSTCCMTSTLPICSSRAPHHSRQIDPHSVNAKLEISLFSFLSKSIQAKVLIRECCWRAIRGNTQAKQSCVCALSGELHPACSLMHLQKSLFHLLARHCISVVFVVSHVRNHRRALWD